jgi:uncharacterized protein YjiS (DUF1127 family)
MMVDTKRAGTQHGGTAAIRLAEMLRRAGTRLVLALLRWQELAQQRRRLLSLDDHMLKDIGLTRAEAMQEGTRPFWDAQTGQTTPWR